MQSEGTAQDTAPNAPHLASAEDWIDALFSLMDLKEGDGGDATAGGAERSRGHDPAGGGAAEDGGSGRGEPPVRAGNERPEAQHVSAPSPHDTTTAAPDGGDATHAGHRSRGHDTAGRDEKEDDSSGRRGLIPAANERPGAEDAASAAPCPHASTPPRGGGDVTDVGNGSTGRHVGERGAEDGGGRGGLTPEVKERPEAQHDELPLIAVPTYSWVGQFVRITTPKHKGVTGLVYTTENGWVRVRTSLGDLPERAYDLIVIPRSRADISGGLRTLAEGDESQGTGGKSSSAGKRTSGAKIRHSESSGECSSLASSEADLEKAREPTESAPASPLGAAVAPATPAGIGAGAGVGTGGRPPFHLERFPWGGRDQGGHPLSLRTKEKIKRGGAPWTMSPEGVLFGEDGNHFFCSSCAKPGDITCCDECPRVFHVRCMPRGCDSWLAAKHQTEHDPWYCPSCTDAGRVNLVDGEDPKWTPRDRTSTPKARREKLRGKVPRATRPRKQQQQQKKNKQKTMKLKMKIPPAKIGKGAERRQGLSSANLPPPGLRRRRDEKGRPETARRRAEAATATTALAEAEALLELSLSAPLVAVSVNGAVGTPCASAVSCGAKEEAFPPELDDALLRSLLYHDGCTHILIPLKEPESDGKPGGAAAAAGGGGGGAGEAAAAAGNPTISGTLPGIDDSVGGTGADGREARPLVKTEAAEALGTLTAHLVLSPRASKRPRLDATRGDTGRLGPPLAETKGPGRVGGRGGRGGGSTAASFGARAADSFRRAGLAATVAEVGLVPAEVKVEAGYPHQIVDETRAPPEREVGNGLRAAAGRAAAGGGGGSSALGSASDGLRSTPRDLEGGAPNRRPHPPAADDSAEGSQTSRGEDTVRRVIGAGGGGGSEGLPGARAQDERRPVGGGGVVSGSGRDIPADSSGGPTDSINVGDDESGQARAGRGGVRSGAAHVQRETHARKGTSSIRGFDGGASADRRSSSSSSGLRQNSVVDAHRMEKAPLLPAHPSGADRDDKENPRGKRKDPLRKANRRWNLKHMRATRGEGRADVCSRCRSRPDGGMMDCCTKKLARFHSFCFPCLRQDGFEKSDLVAGGVKWECPMCRTARARPRRGRSSSLRGAAKKTAAVAGDGDERRKEQPERTWTTRSSSSAQVPMRGGAAAACENLVRHQLFTPPASSRSAEGGSGGGHAFGFRHHGATGRGGGGGGGSGGGSGGSHVQGQQAPPGNQPMEQRRLVRMVAVLALDRLQQLGPLNLFKDTAPVTVPGAVPENTEEAVEPPIDFSTIRRRSQSGLYGSIRDLALDVQRLCANVMAFNDAGSARHNEATHVLKGAKRICPQAQHLLDRLAAAEATASRHGLWAPAAAASFSSSSDEWTHDGPLCGFELTPANEDAY